MSEPSLVPDLWWRHEATVVGRSDNLNVTVAEARDTEHADYLVTCANMVKRAARALSVDPLRLAEALEERLGDVLTLLREFAHSYDEPEAYIEDLRTQAQALVAALPTPAPTEERP